MPIEWLKHTEIRVPVIAWQDWDSAPDWQWARRVTYCTTSDQVAIEAAVKYVSLVIIGRLISMGGECVTLATLLKAKLAGTIVVDCRDFRCVPGKLGISTPNGRDITICGLALPPSSFYSTTEVVFHELIHLCGGNEVDCYTLQYYLLNTGYPGPYIPVPTRTQLNEMCKYGDDWNSLKAGKFMVWVPWTGEVHVKVKYGSDFGLLPTIWGANYAWSIPNGCP